jgi:hypothetical protein
MKNLLDLVSVRTKELNSSKKSSTFNTNDFLLETILDKKMERKQVINLIIVKRIEMSETDIDKLNDKDLKVLIDKYYKTSKNGLDTSVSDSNNNSSFSYNIRYEDYKLLKTGSFLEIVKIKK